ncbi:MAG: GspE/PulE family protein [Desulfobacterales bacterium]|jgi:general secretion pathway protein E|nr:GspE/PulE family protein [Desulfobacterales bacterium]
MKDPFSSKSVCQALLNSGVITAEQAQEILQKESSLRRRLEHLQQKQRQDESTDGEFNPVTFIDLLTPLNIHRADDAFKGIDEDIIFQAFAAEWGLPFFKIDPLKLDLNIVTTTIPKSFAMKHLVLPIAISDGSLTVATSNPFNSEIMEDISRASHMKVQAVVSPKSDIVKIINEFFGFKRSIAAAEDQFSAPGIDLGNLEQYVRLRSSDELPSNDRHIINAVEHLFGYAFDQRASDIHIEPKRETSLIRMRIDGVLHSAYHLPKSVHSAIVSRIKSLSRLDISEKRRPQDGRIKIERNDKAVEIRVSVVPVAFGEKVVMRLMDPDILFQDLAQLGFSGKDLARYNRFIDRPHGIILVCGPTGSGKSTTLYSTLRVLATPEINVTTVEDPIEMIHESFNQIAVQPAVGITFDSILRNILRQDPDVIMLGEMRDLETAQNAVQAALTGHLVLSTLHTNDAPSAITRLIDLGIPAFLIQASLVGIVAQRLVKTICDGCKEVYPMATDELVTMGIHISGNKTVQLYRGKGCQKCRGTGYYGRIGVFEVLPFSEEIKKLTVASADSSAIQVRAKAEGMITLRENALRKMMAGVTTSREVLRVTWEGA